MRKDAAAMGSLLDREAVEEEVAQYLRQTEKGYLEVLRQVQTLLDEYRTTKEGRRAVYRVTTRADYPGTASHLKTIGSIVEKVVERREKLKRRGQPMVFGPQSVGDIVGVRVVCVYPSDVLLVRKYITGLVQKRTLTVVDPFDDKSERSGYRALHVTVSVENHPQQLPCEIQIATMLQEAWSYKVHPLIYKGRNTDKRDELQTRFLSDLLTSIDAQTEIVKNTVVVRSAAEEARRLTLVRTHLVRVFDGDASLERLARSPGAKKHVLADRVDFGALQAQAASQYLRVFVREKRAVLLDPNTRSEAAQQVWREGERFVKQYKLSTTSRMFKTYLEACRVLAVAAVCEDSGQFWEPVRVHALGLRTYAAALSPEDLARAYRYQAWAHFCVGDTATAVELSEKAIREATRLGQKDVRDAAENNMAYFAAELLDQDARKSRGRLSAAERREKGARALKCIDETIAEHEEQFGARPSEPDARDRWYQLRDTKGYLLIATGRDARTVDAGTDLCKELLRDRDRLTAGSRDIAVAYAAYHVARGRERLVELNTACHDG